ncbi:hypothetical protein TSUD_77550 [Trifolium subterraneum]|uniref:THIF-type NAD/FAD binding fold domain-containing protein n=1 Tax=Trifolium subterraneum TaxID=3900 RepID=A0A2Z6LST2_TRISU|nr:hypothetical protein TSUD_77550 [Trifolium subterraneum]
MDGDGEELTAQETALYDRQIRVWGADAQRSLTLIDDRLVTEEALSVNFLIPPDENVYSGKTIAQLCCDSLKDFNPMVRVFVEKGDLSIFDVDFFGKFDVVVVSCSSRSAKKLANEKCRKASRRVAFYTVECRDSCGEIFVDLQDYKYSKDALSVPWSALHRRMSKLYFAMRVIEKFEEAEGRSAGDLSDADLSSVLKLKKELCAAQSLNESHVPDTLLERLVADTTEFPPVSAVIGGILGQEVIKAISGKGDPIKNFFYFDASDGKGVIEDISESNTGK